MSLILEILRVLRKRVQNLDILAESNFQISKNDHLEQRAFLIQEKWLYGLQGFTSIYRLRCSSLQYRQENINLVQNVRGACLGWYFTGKDTPGFGQLIYWKYCNCFHYSFAAPPSHFIFEWIIFLILTRSNIYTIMCWEWKEWTSPPEKMEWQVSWLRFETFLKSDHGWRNHNILLIIL